MSTYLLRAAASLATLACVAAPAAAQNAALRTMRPAAAPQPLYSMEGDYVNAHGEPVVVPAGYAAPMGCAAGCCGPGYCDDGGYGDGGYGDGAYCDGGCCDGACGVGGCGGMAGGPGGLCGACGGVLGACLCGNAGAGLTGYDPFGGAGQNTENCGPYYFDFSAEFVRYKRYGNPLGGGGVISTYGFANDLSPNAIASQAAITTDGVQGGDNGNGYRLTGRMDLGALSLVELSYTGIYDTANGDAVAIADVNGTITPGNPNDNQTLYTVFNNYGFANGGVVDPDGPFAFTDNALEHRLSYRSELHTAEASFRRYWVGYSPRVSGTWLVGFRYTDFKEKLNFFSRSALGSTNLGLNADNRLAGAQVGVDGWVTLLQGLRVGGETKVGLYNNDYRIGSVKGDTASFLGQASLSVIVDVLPSWSIRGGYEILYMSDLALVRDGFLAPGGLGGPTLGHDPDGDATFHGFHVGADYIY